MFGLFNDTIDYTNTNMWDRREILDKLLRSGRYADITFRKKTTGEVVTRTVKLWIERHLTSGDRNNVGVNIPAALDPDLYPYSDIKADGFRSFSLNNLISVKASGKMYKFN
jgi:hypothetical protein